MRSNSANRGIDHVRWCMLLQAWLDRHEPFDVIVDGANVGMFNQNFVEGGFNFYQVCVFIL